MENIQNEGIDLSRMSVADLLGLIGKAQREVEQRRASEKKALRDEFVKRAQELGVTLEEVMGLTGTSAQRRRGAYKPGEAKFVNPYDESQTWTGRGRKPQWVLNYLNDGGTLEDLQIKK